jgi:hypothetical protein
MEKPLNNGLEVVLNYDKKKGAPTSKSFKNFVNATKDKRRVLPSLERFVLSAPEDPRRTDVLHPSEMAKQDWCHRASYFLLKGEPAPVKSFGFKTKMIFETGHRMHSMWQDLFYKQGTLYGNWRCKRCQFPFSNVVGFEKCPSCQEGSLDYKEVPVRSEKYRIAGHSDGILVGYGETPLLLEIKTVGPGSFRYEMPDLFYKHSGNFAKMWSEFNSPFMSHILQVQIYMRLMEDDPKILHKPQEAVFIYHGKPNDEVKEIIIPKRNFGVDEVFNAAAKIVKAVEENNAPNCNVPERGKDDCPKCRGYNVD